MLLSPRSLLLFASAILLSSGVTTAVSLSPRASVCNGHPELCSRSFGNVTFVGAHDSYAVGVNNLATNQDYNITQQLNDGIRMLQVQAHNDSNVIQLCHTSCVLFNGGAFQDYLGTVKTWLSANPTEVLSLLIVNSDNFPPTAYDTIFKAAGLDTLSYSPPSSALPATGWPTLGSLIDAGTRLITFMDTGANYASVPYIIDEFTNIWETAFDVTTQFDCAINRSNGDTSTEMFLINHFFDTIVLGQPAPDAADANITNAASGVQSLGAQVDLCVADYGRSPNFMLVDFYEYGGGSVFQVAAAANGVTYSPSTPIATPVPTTSSTGSSSSTSGATSAFQMGPQQLAISLAVLTGMLAGAWTVA